jgi:carbon storage regulator
MLSLCRKAGETIHIGSDIVITVQRVRGNRTYIAVAAPREIPIYRGELVDDRPTQENSDDRI